MDGKIMSDGNLFIKRSDEHRAQRCPIVSEPLHAAQCGDWCPLFSEPEMESNKYNHKKGDPLILTGRTILEICQQKTLIFENFIDERETT